MRHLAPIVIAAVAVVVIVYRLRRQHRTGRPATTWSSLLRSRLGPADDQAPRLGVVGLVAGREVRQRLRGRTFRVATVLLLVGVAAAVIIPAVNHSSSHAEQVGLVGADTAALRQAVAAVGRSTGSSVHVVTEPDAATADDALRSGRLDVVIIDRQRIVVQKATAREDPFPLGLAQLLGLADAVRAAGLDPAQAATLAHASPLPVTSLEPARSNTTGRSTAAISLVIMFVLLTQYLTWTLIGVMEEKSSRVIEVLLATVRPLQLLAGKVLGIAAVVFAQAVALAVVALALAGAVGSDLLHGKAPLVLLSALAWLVLGYAFYSWLYAAAGSTVERQDQVQSLALPLSIPLIAGYVLGIIVAGSGTAPAWFEVLAYLPPTAPFAMTTLVGLGAASWWQFLLAAALSVASTFAVARVAATVYRRAVLRTGRRVTFREIIALARSA